MIFASGRYFDGLGNLNNWWQKGAARSFDRHAQCFINQYAQYHIGNQHVNGLLTLDENARNPAEILLNENVIIFRLLIMVVYKLRIPLINVT